jgi:hypothetical protein
LAGLIARARGETALAGGGRTRSAAGPECQRVRDARLTLDSSHQKNSHDPSAFHDEQGNCRRPDKPPPPEPKFVPPEDDNTDPTRK